MGVILSTLLIGSRSSKCSEVSVKNHLRTRSGLEDLVSVPGRSLYAPWKFNIAPENGWLEDKFPFGIPYFQGLC